MRAASAFLLCALLAACGAAPEPAAESALPAEVPALRDFGGIGGGLGGSHHAAHFLGPKKVCSHVAFGERLQLQEFLTHETRQMHRDACAKATQEPSYGREQDALRCQLCMSS